MILTKYITIKINKGNIGTFRKINNNIKINDIIDIPVDKLAENSCYIVDVRCDICGIESETTYMNYTRNNKKYNIYTCKKCSDIKSKKTCLQKYGVNNYAKTNESIEKQKQTFIQKYNVDNPLKNQKIKEKTLKKITNTKEEFINKAIKIHGNKYNYNKVEYINNKIPVQIICKEHGIFKQRPDSHLNGKGCFSCGCNINEKQIYLIKDLDYNIYKIGMSNHPQIRIKRIINETKTNIDTIKIFKNYNGLCEKIIHKSFKEYNIVHPIEHGGKTEWFNFSPKYNDKDIVSIIDNITTNTDMTNI